MLAIHAIWSQRMLALWAEDSGPPAAVPAGRAAQPRDHPFATSSGPLADVLAEFGEVASDLVRKAADDELTLWLPGGPGGPAASPDLIRDSVPGKRAGSGQQAAPSLAGWRVPALTFEPAAAL